MDDVQPWWKKAVFYQIYPRSFADSTGDGVGDLDGIRQHLDHLVDLGVDAVWVSPFYPSPMCDGGYDISDYCDVDPTFGTLGHFDRLLAEAHDRGLRLIVDWVPNHTSDQHPWFQDSISSTASAHRDWYIWRDEPNNWRAAFTKGSAWTLDERSQQYYLHFFLPQQPDLNWVNDEVVHAMHGVLRFWLDRGVDGFRIDVAHCVGKDPTFSDDPRCLAGEPIASFNDQPRSHEVLRGVRSLVDTYPNDGMIVGEVNIRSTTAVVRYYGSGDELNLTFNFPPLDAPWDAIVWQSVINEVHEKLGGSGAWPTWVLSNHDNQRHRTRYGGSLERAWSAAVLLLTLRGTPFLFQGEELGLEDAVIEPDEVVDPGGRDGARAPIPWTPQAPHGWDGDAPWLPFPPDPERHNAESEKQDDRSTFALYSRLIEVRRANAALQLGDFDDVEGMPHDVIAFRRSLDGDEWVTLVNFADATRDVALDGTWSVAVTSDRSGEGERFDGHLLPDQAVLLHRVGRRDDSTCSAATPRSRWRAATRSSGCSRTGSAGFG
ncbi:MAG TPA: alpha-amylase family glycosyl hydrolase [Actinomycetales bacterium]|nr:alpha-amylase family glycosyl hydrolase [Actinomycetales bacterium]